MTGPLDKPRIFLSKRASDDETSQLCVRDGWDGKDRLFVDPRVRNSDSAHYTLDDAYPSPDG